MKNKLPLVVRVSVPQKGFDADAIDAEVYCVNNTSVLFTVSTQSESFTTVDEEVGTAVAHGSPPGMYRLAPGESVRIAEVRGWEWDGHVGIELAFQSSGKGAVIVKSYDLKGSHSDFLIPSSGLQGRVIKPLK